MPQRHYAYDLIKDAEDMYREHLSDKPYLGSTTQDLIEMIPKLIEVIEELLDDLGEDSDEWGGY